MTSLHIQELRERLYLTSEAARSSREYCAANGIDWAETFPATGGVYLVDILRDGRRFAPARPDEPDAVVAAIVDAIGADGETVEDLVAWPVDNPRRVLTAWGMASVLGKEAAANPATFFLGQPLRLFRTPLAWLRARCEGACAFDLARAATWLRDLDCRRAPEDLAHAEEIRAALVATLHLDQIVLPQDAA